MGNKLQVDGHKLIYHLDELQKWLKGEFFYPLHLDIGVSSACNYRCVHCYYDYQDHKSNMLEPRRLIRLISEISEIGVKSIYFASNGEPLMNKALPDAIVCAKRGGIDVAMSTNGVLLDTDTSKIILGNLSWIRVSMLAASRKKYCLLHKASADDYKRVIKNLEQAVYLKQKNKLSTIMGAQMCILPDNGNEVSALAKMVKDIGLNYIAIRPISQNIRNNFKVQRDLIQKFASQLKKAQELECKDFQVSIRCDLENERKTYTKCLGLPFISYIAADGGVYACGCFLGENKYFLGSIYKNSFKDIWLSKRRSSVMKRITNNPDFKRCDILCRHHAINKFLDQLINPPIHKNFI